MAVAVGLGIAVSVGLVVMIAVGLTVSVAVGVVVTITVGVVVTVVVEIVVTVTVRVVVTVTVGVVVTVAVGLVASEVRFLARSSNVLAVVGNGLEEGVDIEPSGRDLVADGVVITAPLLSAIAGVDIACGLVITTEVGELLAEEVGSLDGLPMPIGTADVANAVGDVTFASSDGN